MIKKTKPQIKAMLKRLTPGQTLTVWFNPSNMRFNGHWGMTYQCTFDYEGLRADTADVISFEDTVNSFTYYNCNNETGKRVHFYVEGAEA